MSLDRNEVERIAALVRISLTEEEMETLGEELSDILDQFQVLSELDNFRRCAHRPPSPTAVGDARRRCRRFPGAGGSPE